MRKIKPPSRVRHGGHLYHSNSMHVVEPIAACPFVLMKLHMEGPTSALPV